MLLTVIITVSGRPLRAGDANQSKTTDDVVGSTRNGGALVATGQTVKPAGETIAFAGRPVDLALSPDAATVYVKNIHGLTVLDAKSWKVRQELPFNRGGSSLHGIAVARDGKHIYVSTADSSIHEALVGGNGQCSWARSIEVRGKGAGASYPIGLALSADGARAYVALSRHNSLAIVDLAAGKLASEIAVGVAPFDVVLSPDEQTAYVSNWGGRRPKTGERVAPSSGTDLLVDERGIPNSGTVSKIDLATRAVVAEIAVGLHPSDLELQRDGSTLYVANANSDSVSIIATKKFQIVETVLVHPDAALPFGSLTDAVALSPDGRTLYAANGGNNAVAVIALGRGFGGRSAVRGFIPAGWFPAALATAGDQLFVANVKGDGSRQPESDGKKWHVTWHRGAVSKVAAPLPAVLARFTEQVRADALVPQALRAFERARRGVRPVPVPARVGEPSVFEHVVYVVKENRTYDQVFGDMPRGNSDPKLCIYGRQITPNHHALAEEFVLLDNYYCNGVVSADGHQWATQGIATDYEEKSFGGWARGYDFGADPLAFAPTGFIWDNALLHGLSFRNYGEFDVPTLEPAAAGWADVYDDYKSGANKIGFRQSIANEPLRRYTCANYPGWNLRIPDVLRIDRFLKELADYETKGNWPNLIIVYLPQDHTSGTGAGVPTPRAYVADNDLALGRLVEAVSKSKFWPTTCIFINEDDPQNGFDHVDGHRSLCLVASPYTKRGAVVSRFYNQCSVLHTIERILGLPPMTQLDALAPTMEDCFTSKPDLTAYTARPNVIALNEMNKAAAALEPEELLAQQTSERLDLSQPDRIDDDVFNRILWLAAKGPDVPYPARFAGAHGRGLRKLHLRFDARARDEDDD